MGRLDKTRLESSRAHLKDSIWQIVLMVLDIKQSCSGGESTSNLEPLCKRIQFARLFCDPSWVTPGPKVSLEQSHCH